MSRFLSLCTQRSGCGRLAKSVQWLTDKCKDDKWYGKEEVLLGKAIGKAGCVGWSAAERKKAVEELACLSACDEHETEQSKRVKGRVLICMALLVGQTHEKRGQSMRVPTSLFGDCVAGTLSVDTLKEAHKIDCGTHEKNGEMVHRGECTSQSVRKTEGTEQEKHVHPQQPHSLCTQ